MKRIMSAVVVMILVLVVAVFGIFYFNKNDLSSIPFLESIGKLEMKPLVLNQEDISNITKPGVVSIYHHIEGNVTIPYFDIDWNKLDIIFPTTKKPINIPVDQYIRGSGFIVSNNGYIITNAHVASDISYKRAVAQQLMSLRFAAALQSEQEIKQLDAILKAKGIQDVDTKQFGEDLALNLGKKLADKITMTGSQKIVVLNPSSTGTKLSDLIASGFPASIVAVNDNYIEDEKDVAILKIDQTNLPVLDLSSTETISIGNKIYVYGFPSTGQFNTNDILEPTFTAGTVSGLKDSKTKVFKVIETDAKVSSGSSGGPLLNEQGEVVGILTFASSATTAGDAFAFAIPISLAKDILEYKNILLERSKWMQDLKDGMLHLQNNRCQESIQDFKNAENINSSVFANKNIQAYIDTCAATIASGKSIDTAFAEFKIWMSNLGSLSWVLVGFGIIIFIIIIFVIFKLIKRIREDELEINHLEHNTASTNNPTINASSMSSAPPTIINSTLKPVDLGLLNYVKGAHAAGLSNDVITVNLKKGGWTDADISRAISQSLL